MCCRVATVKKIGDMFLILAPDQIIGDLDGILPNYNAGPGQELPLFELADGKRTLRLSKWGIHLQNRGASSNSSPIFNSRMETISASTSYADKICATRVILPCDGYYEWQKTGKEKRPFHFTGKDGAMLFLGAISSVQDGKSFFSIVTMPAEIKISFIHDRMPLLVREDEVEIWLGNDKTYAELLEQINKKPRPSLDFYPVSKFVNSIRNNSPECLRRCEHAYEEGLGI